MKNRNSILWLLVLAITIQFGGFGLYAHNLLQHNHHAFASVAGCEEHDGGQPRNPQPDDDDDCPSCLTITHTFGTAVFLSDCTLILGVVGYQVGFPAEQIVETSLIHLPPGRGPPLTSI